MKYSILRRPPEVLPEKDGDGKAREAYDALMADYSRIRALLIELGEYWIPIRNAFPGLKGCPCWRDVGLGDDSTVPIYERIVKENEAERLIAEYDMKHSFYTATYNDCLGTSCDTYSKVRALLKKVTNTSSGLDSHWRDDMRTLLEEVVSCSNPDIAKAINESFPKMSFMDKVSSKLTDWRIGLRNRSLNIERWQLKRSQKEKDNG